MTLVLMEMYAIHQPVLVANVYSGADDANLLDGTKTKRLCVSAQLPFSIRLMT